MVQLPEQKEDSHKAGSRHVTNNPEMGAGHWNTPRAVGNGGLSRQRGVTIRHKAQSYLKALPGREGVSGDYRNWCPTCLEAQTLLKESELSGGDGAYKGKESGAIGGKHVLGSMWYTEQVEGHASGHLRNKHLCRGCTHEKSKEQNWPPTYRKCSLDESLPI